GEGDGDAAVAGAALRGDRGDAGDAGHRALDDGGDLLVDDLGRGPGVGGADGDDRLVGARQLADLDGAERGEAGDHDQEVEDDGQDGAADAEGGDAGASLPDAL